ncbi:MAG: hypothetical protein JXL84_24145 [Deltaproteobacteria bacterium]|nr:hypothetical protein [Deltaproteobacteria bacterium]
MKKISFRKFEHMIVPQFRQKMNEAESITDVKTGFSHAVTDFFDKAFEGRFRVGPEDVVFKPSEQPNFSLGQRLSEDGYFQSFWRDSDVAYVIGRLAESAAHRYKHLEKHREKTVAKIR